MTKFFYAFFFLLFNYTIVSAQDIPPRPQQLVNDYTNTLSKQQINQLEQKLIAFDDSTSNQIAVVILKTVGDYDINEYTLELGRKWGVGGKSKNNGVVVLVALGDRKIAIQTGYGLEGALPDIYTKRIIENEIKPFFKNGQYYEGLEAGTNAIIQLTKGEYKAERGKNSKQESGGIASVLSLLIIIIIVMVLLRRGGGGGSNNGHIISSRGIADAILWSTLLGGGNRNSGNGFGGDSFGGSGGFGGFGGGSFGGGGSSGSW